MTELYRGLLLVLSSKFNELIVAFRTHVQSFNQHTADPESYFDVGVLGFWNLMLEIVLTIFSLICLIAGVIVIAALAVTFYPCHALITYSSLLLKNTRGPQPSLTQEKVSPATNNEQPVIVRKDGKEKE